MLVERRVFLVDAELRAASDGKSISGYAARYNTLSGPIPAGKGSALTYRERLAPGAFRNAVKSGQDVTMLVQHDNNKLLGRTSSGTLNLKDDDKGLQFRCEMPDTQLGHDTHEMIRRGDLNACSFGFMLGDRSDDSWEEEEIEDDEDLFGADEDDEKKQKRGPEAFLSERSRQKALLARKTTRQAVRTIHNVRKLLDVSVVTRAAYPNGTCVQARGIEIAYPEIPAEIRAVIEAAESTEERLVREFGADKVVDAAFKQGQGAEAVRSRRRNLLNQV
jgi:HK97 family phage prohead protease